jgi:signal transduction histidine kinase
MEFNSGAASSGPAGLHFGTSRGLVVVPRGTAFPSLAPSPTVLTSIRTLAGPLVAQAPIWRLEQMKLPYGQPVTFEFAVLDLEREPRHRYAYRLEGLRDDWIDLGARREITFADLSPGDYRLTVRGRNARGVWSETGLELDIVPPFWMTLWFRFGLLGATALLALTLHYRRTSVLTRRNAELLRIQAEREQALARVRASERELQQAYRELQDLTRRLEVAKEEERQHIARELHDQMGQVLSAVKINLVLLATEQDSADRTRRTDDAVAQVDRMIRHVRELSLDLRPPLLDEIGLVAALRVYLEAQGRRSEIEMRLDADARPVRLPPEMEIHLFRLVQEAVTNVIRHSGATHVRVTMKLAGPVIDVTVRDDGRGFDVGAVMARSAQGDHLGLLGMHERVRSLGGEMTVDSTPGGGTAIRIRVSLPA